VADDLVEHARLRIRAELEWHQLVLNQLAKLTTGSERAGSERAGSERAGSERADSEPAGGGSIGAQHTERARA
jgi:hypothetical protein